MEYYKNNILVPDAVIEALVEKERPLNFLHEGTIIHSEAFNLNAHAKFKVTHGVVAWKHEGDTLRIFVPNECSSSSLINILSNWPMETKIILDIRSYFREGKEIIELFKPFLQQFDCGLNYGTARPSWPGHISDEDKASITPISGPSWPGHISDEDKAPITPLANRLYFHLVPPYVFSKKRDDDTVKGRFSSGDVTVLVNKKTLHEADVYSAAVLYYFRRHFKIIGQLPETAAKMFRVFDIDGFKVKVAIAELD
jgi:hypothetical protein